MPVDTSKANDVWARYQWLRDNGHLAFIAKADKCEQFFIGNQWDRNDLALLRASKRPALTINKIISTIANVLGEQIFNRTDVAFRPRNEGATSEVADALTKVFMQISDNNQLPWTRSDVFCDGIVSSRGFFDVRLDFSDSLRGEVRIEQINPKNVLIDSDADEYDPDRWQDVVVTKWLSADQIELLYSKADADMLRNGLDASAPYSYDAVDSNRDRFGFARAQNPGNVGAEYSERNNNRNIRVIERQWRKLDKMLHFVDLATGDMRAVPAEMLENEQLLAQHLAQNPGLSTTKKLVQRVRWTVVAGNVVLHDDWSPYKHFTVVPYFPFFRRGTTVGLVENLLGPQEMLNKVRSQELHIVNTTANSGWKVKKNSLKNMSIGELEQRGAQTGLVLELDEMDGAEKIVPNATPTGLDRISFKAEEDIKNISGVSDYMQGNPREDVAAKAVTANKQSGQANLAKVMDNMNRTDFILARNVLDIVQEYYSEERLVYITQDRLTNAVATMKVNEVTPEGVIANDLSLGEYMVVVTNQPERDTFADTQFEQAVRLRLDAGVQIPDKFIIEASRLKNKADIVAALEAAANDPVAQKNAELDMRAKEAEIAKIEADTMSKSTDAQLKQAKAMTEMGTDHSAQAELELEREKALAEHQLEREKMEMEFALKREQMEREFQLKAEMASREMAIKEEAMKQQAMNDRVAAASGAKAGETKTTEGAAA